MFQITYLPSHGITLVHPLAVSVNADLLFEKELLFVWDHFSDPHHIKDILGRFLPFAPAVLPRHQLCITQTWNKWIFSMTQDDDDLVQGVVLIGVEEEDFHLLDQHQQAPIHRCRTKTRCRIGNLDRIAHIYIQQGALLAE